jgi:hypothetical protein
MLPLALSELCMVVSFVLLSHSVEPPVLQHSFPSSWKPAAEVLHRRTPLLHRFQTSNLVQQSGSRWDHFRHMSDDTKIEPMSLLVILVPHGGATTPFSRTMKSILANSRAWANTSPEIPAPTMITLNDLFSASCMVSDGSVRIVLA